MNIKVVTGLLVIGLYVWFIWPESSPSTQTPISSVKNHKTPKKSRKPDVGPKFIKYEDIEVKAKLGENESDKLTKKVPAPPLSKELQEEYADVRKNGYGTLPPVNLKENLNPQKLSVIEAIQSGSNPERLSVVGKRGKFNLEEYKRNPSAYLDVVQPSRAYDSAQPGEGVKRLTRVTNQYIETYQGEPVELTVTGAEDGAPVSAVVHDGGHFQNDLSAITLKATGGSATLQFTPTSGVIQNTRITVASPLSSGVVHFNIYVRKKREQVQQ